MKLRDKVFNLTGNTKSLVDGVTTSELMKTPPNDNENFHPIILNDDVTSENLQLAFIDLLNNDRQLADNKDFSGFMFSEGVAGRKSLVFDEIFQTYIDSIINAKKTDYNLNIESVANDLEPIMNILGITAESDNTLSSDSIEEITRYYNYLLNIKYQNNFDLTIEEFSNVPFYNDIPRLVDIPSKRAEFYGRLTIQAGGSTYQTGPPISIHADNSDTFSSGDRGNITIYGNTGDDTLSDRLANLVPLTYKYNWISNFVQNSTIANTGFFVVERTNDVELFNDDMQANPIIPYFPDGSNNSYEGINNNQQSPNWLMNIPDVDKDPTNIVGCIDSSVKPVYSDALSRVYCFNVDDEVLFPSNDFNRDYVSRYLSIFLKYDGSETNYDNRFRTCLQNIQQKVENYNESNLPVEESLSFEILGDTSVLNTLEPIIYPFSSSDDPKDPHLRIDLKFYCNGSQILFNATRLAISGGTSSKQQSGIKTVITGKYSNNLFDITFKADGKLTLYELVNMKDSYCLFYSGETKIGRDGNISGTIPPAEDPFNEDSVWIARSDVYGEMNISNHPDYTNVIPMEVYNGNIPFIIIDQTDYESSLNKDDDGNYKIKPPGAEGIRLLDYASWPHDHLTNLAGLTINQIVDAYNAENGTSLIVFSSAPIHSVFNNIPKDDDNNYLIDPELVFSTFVLKPHIAAKSIESQEYYMFDNQIQANQIVKNNKFIAVKRNVFTENKYIPGLKSIADLKDIIATITISNGTAKLDSTDDDDSSIVSNFRKSWTDNYPIVIKNENDGIFDSALGDFILAQKFDLKYRRDLISFVYSQDSGKSVAPYIEYMIGAESDSIESDYTIQNDAVYPNNTSLYGKYPLYSVLWQKINTSGDNRYALVNYNQIFKWAGLRRTVKLTNNNLYKQNNNVLTVNTVDNIELLNNTGVPLQFTYGQSQKQSDYLENAYAFAYTQSNDNNSWSASNTKNFNPYDPSTIIGSKFQLRQIPAETQPINISITENAAKSFMIPFGIHKKYNTYTDFNTVELNGIKLAVDPSYAGFNGIEAKIYAASQWRTIAQSNVGEVIIRYKPGSYSPAANGNSITFVMDNVLGNWVNQYTDSITEENAIYPNSAFALDGSNVFFSIISTNVNNDIGINQYAGNNCNVTSIVTNSDGRLEITTNTFFVRQEDKVNDDIFVNANLSNNAVSFSAIFFKLTDFALAGERLTNAIAADTSKRDEFVKQYYAGVTDGIRTYIAPHTGISRLPFTERWYFNNTVNKIDDNGSNAIILPQNIKFIAKSTSLRLYNGEAGESQAITDNAFEIEFGEKDEFDTFIAGESFINKFAEVMNERIANKRSTVLDVALENHSEIISNEFTIITFDNTIADDSSATKAFFINNIKINNAEFTVDSDNIIEVIVETSYMPEEITSIYIRFTTQSQIDENNIIEYFDFVNPTFDELKDIIAMGSYFFAKGAEGINGWRSGDGAGTEQCLYDQIQNAIAIKEAYEQNATISLKERRDALFINNVYDKVLPKTTDAVVINFPFKLNMNVYKWYFIRVSGITYATGQNLDLLDMNTIAMATMNTSLTSNNSSTNSYNAFPFFNSRYNRVGGLYPGIADDGEIFFKIYYKYVTSDGYEWYDVEDGDNTALLEIRQQRTNTQSASGVKGDYLPPYWTVVSAVLSNDVYSEKYEAMMQERQHNLDDETNDPSTDTYRKYDINSPGTILVDVYNGKIRFRLDEMPPVLEDISITCYIENVITGKPTDEQIFHIDNLADKTTVTLRSMIERQNNEISNVHERIDNIYNEMDNIRYALPQNYQGIINEAVSNETITDILFVKNDINYSISSKFIIVDSNGTFASDTVNFNGEVDYVTSWTNYVQRMFAILVLTEDNLTDDLGYSSADIWAEFAIDENYYSTMANSGKVWAEFVKWRYDIIVLNFSLTGSRLVKKQGDAGGAAGSGTVQIYKLSLVGGDYYQIIRLNSNLVPVYLDSINKHDVNSGRIIWNGTDFDIIVDVNQQPDGISITHSSIGKMQIKSYKTGAINNTTGVFDNNGNINNADGISIDNNNLVMANSLLVSNIPDNPMVGVNRNILSFLVGTTVFAYTSAQMQYLNNTYRWINGVKHKIAFQLDGKAWTDDDTGDINMYEQSSYYPLIKERFAPHTTELVNNQYVRPQWIASYDSDGSTEITVAIQAFVLADGILGDAINSEDINV